MAVPLLLIMGAKSALADINVVPSGSMEPTIQVGDVVFVNKLAYDLKVPFTQIHIAEWSDPSRGDIIVVFSPVDGTRLVKRVVAVPGDTMTADNGAVVRVPPGKYFVMGDNRGNSFDSRYFGFVDRRQVVGKAKGVFVSADPSHYLKPRFGRFFSPLN